MISLFRKIRKSLLVQGKVTRYIIYAFGEILLVVIGILIALQVNNNNELKKSKAKEREQLVYVLENIKKDSAFISGAVRRRERTLKMHDNLNAFLAGEITANEAGSIDIVSSIFPFNPVTKKNNPNLANEVLSLELKKEILDYYASNDFSIWNTSRYNEIIQTIVMPFLMEKELFIYPSLFGEDGVDKADINKGKFFEELQKPALQQVLYLALEKLRFTGVLRNLSTNNNDLKNAIQTYLDEQ